MSYLNKRISVILGVAIFALLLGAAAPASAVPNEVFRVGFTDLVSTNPVIADYTVPGTCATNDAPARMLEHNPVTWPEISLEMDAAPGAAIVQVNLDERGAVVSDSISTSSGNKPMDWTALSAIRSAMYSPEVSRCKATAGSYLVGVAFVCSRSNTLPAFPLTFGSAPIVRY